VPKELHKRQSKHIHSRHGFEGCMSGLEYNGESPDMVENATIPSTLITVGCDGKFMDSLHQSKDWNRTEKKMLKLELFKYWELEPY